MSKEIGIATPVATVFAITVMAVLVSQSFANRAPAYAHYVPHYTRSGKMILPPKQCLAQVGLCWVTTHPQRAQQWQGIIPGISQRLHPWAYAIYKRTNQSPNGTTMFKELQLTSGPAQHPDRSRTEQSGRDISPAYSRVPTLLLRIRSASRPREGRGTSISIITSPGLRSTEITS